LAGDWREYVLFPRRFLGCGRVAAVDDVDGVSEEVDRCLVRSAVQEGVVRNGG
jgi:hypothetical protein